MTSPYIYILPLLLQQIRYISAFNNSSTHQFMNASRIVKSSNSNTKRLLPVKVVTNIKQYPFMASLHPLLELGTSFCGASIIHPTWALTAAQCLLDKDLKIKATYEVMVITGVITMKEIHDDNMNFPAKLFPHESFIKGEVIDDIGLILLDKPVKNIPAHGLARLPYDLLRPWEAPLDLFWTCKGFGWISDYSDSLRVVHLQIWNNIDCFQKLTDSMAPLEISELPQLSKRVICTQNSLSVKDTCPGQEGGPLICSNFQLGVYSWGNLWCSYMVYPKLYVRVDLYLDWIYKKIPKSELRSLGNILSKLSTVCMFIAILIVN